MVRLGHWEVNSLSDRDVCLGLSGRVLRQRRWGCRRSRGLRLHRRVLDNWWRGLHWRVLDNWWLSLYWG